MKSIDESDNLKCSFCGKCQKDIEWLIVGPSVYICNGCVDLCNEIIKEKHSENKQINTACIGCKHRELGWSVEYDESNLCKAKPIAAFDAFIGSYDAWPLCREKNDGACPDFETRKKIVNGQDKEKNINAENQQTPTE